MPFDPSGNFSRDFNWQQDRDNGIRILASRMDGECDNFAQAFNVTFLRTGIVPMSGNLAMGQNYLTGLGAGNAAALALRYADDPTSGFFLNGIGKPSMVAAGTTRLEANATGVNIFGALTQGGVQVALSSDLAAYAPLAGAAFTGPISTTGITSPIFAIDANTRFLKPTSTLVDVAFDVTDVLRYDQGANQYDFFIGGTPAFRVTASGVVAPSNLNANTLQRGGNTVWDAGNLPNPASTVSPAFTGVPTAPNAAGGTNTTQIATTAFVLGQIGLSFASPAFTGIPTAPNAAGGTNTTQIATTAFVQGQLTLSLAGYALLASPALTGTPTTNGNEIGTRDLPQSVLSAAFSFLASYRGGHVYYTGGAAAATIQPNSTTAMPIGTAIAIVNDGSGVLTLTRGAGVALVFNNVNGDHALAAGGMATMVKVGTDRWFASGVGLT